MSATASRDRATGRYAARPEFARCEECGWTLAENLAGGEYCPRQRCGRYRHVVGVAAGVQAGLVTPAVLGPAWLGTTLETCIRDVALGRIAAHSAVTDEMVTEWQRLNPSRVKT